MSQIGKGSQRLNTQPRLIELPFNRKQRPALYPAVPHSQILRKSSLVVSRAQKLISFPKAVPLFFRKSRIAALYHVIIHRNDVKRRRIGGSIWIGIILKPVHETRALRNFMCAIAVIPLAFADQLASSSRRGKVTLRTQCQRAPKRITYQKSGKTGQL